MACRLVESGLQRAHADCCPRFTLWCSESAGISLPSTLSGLCGWVLALGLLFVAELLPLWGLFRFVTDELAEALEGFVLDLPDAFASQTYSFSDFLERQRFEFVEAVAQPQDFGLSRAYLIEKALQHLGLSVGEDGFIRLRHARVGQDFRKR